MKDQSADGQRLAFARAFLFGIRSGSDAERLAGLRREADFVW